MERKQRLGVILSTIGVCLILFGTTMAFFNYTRTGISNTVRVGKISFESEQTNTISLIDVFPIDKTTVNSSNDVGTVTITIEGDTTYDDGVEYELTVSNLTNTVGNKEIPIDVSISTSGIGDSDPDYFDNRGGNSPIYKLLTTGTISNNKQLLVGYIPKGATGVDGTVTIKAYLDKDKIAISDTYPEGDVTHTEGEEPNQTTVTDYTNGTTSEWVGDRVVLTTTEWNNLHANGVSFQVKVEANEGTWTKNPIVCKRVTNVANLHTETCNQTSNYCAADGYTGSNTTITYGNAKANGSTLAVGDAFDCDVNGDETFDSTTERFYYVSPYYNTQTEKFDKTYATLIYYNNYVNGLPSDGGAAYASKEDAQLFGMCTYSDGCNWYGPVTAVSHLPTTSTWKNLTLKSETRAILSEFHTAHNSKITNYGTLPTAFSYSGKAARLLTAQEVMNGCGFTEIGNSVSGELNNCQFLFENLQYADSNRLTFGIWLETLWNTASPYGICVPTSYSRSITGPYSAFTNVGVRPTIDVPLSKIEY